MAEWFADFKQDFITCFVTKNRWKYLVSGFGNTIKITFMALVFGVIIGIILSMIRATWDKNCDSMRKGFGRTVLSILNGFAKLYLTVIRGTPAVVQLLIIYYVVFASSNNGVMVAAFAFGINSGAYVAEIIRGGIMSIDAGQFEAGRSLGFNYIQTMWHIIIPQALKNVLPSLVNEFITLLKETSVAGYVSVQELTKGGDVIRGVTYISFMPLFAVALIYLIVVMLFTWLLGKLERHLRNTGADPVQNDS